MGAFIVIEGIDGAGKSTLSAAIRGIFSARGQRVTAVSFPRYETSGFAQLAQAALYHKYPPLVESPLAMAMLFAADRAAFKTELIELIAQHDVVIVDRYIASNVAYTAARLGYQSIDEGLWLGELEVFQFGLPRPDLQILLATNVDIAGKRAAQREVIDQNRSKDSYEANKELQAQTHFFYGELAVKNWLSPWLVVDPAVDNESLSDSIQSFLD